MINKYILIFMLIAGFVFITEFSITPYAMALTKEGNNSNLNLNSSSLSICRHYFSEHCEKN